MRADRVPGLGIVKGFMLTFTRLLQPKITVQYPEVVQPIAPKHRGRLLLLYDEYGALKCETCFQCAAACPIECIDMGGVDTKNRFHVHWGPAEQYDERREESALRRSGRPVPDRTFDPFEPIDLGPLDAVLAREEYDPKRAVQILEGAQDAYGHLPGGRAPARRAPDRRVVLGALRHRHLVPAPAVRAAEHARRSRLSLRHVRGPR